MSSGKKTDRKFGFAEFETYLETNFSTPFKKIEPEDQEVILDFLEKNADSPTGLGFFYNTTKRYSIEHFTSSEYFLTNYLDYEMVPGRYLGCVNI